MLYGFSIYAMYNTYANINKVFILTVRANDLQIELPVL